jgi:hypothetical protein
LGSLFGCAERLDDPVVGGPVGAGFGGDVALVDQQDDGLHDVLTAALTPTLIAFLVRFGFSSRCRLTRYMRVVGRKLPFSSSEVVRTLRA